MLAEAIKAASILSMKDAEMESMAEAAIDGFFQNDLRRGFSWQRQGAPLV